MVFRIDAFPMPGPPERTDTLDVSAVTRAFLWGGVNSNPSFACAAAIPPSMSRAPHGSDPNVRRAISVATPSSALRSSAG